MNLNLFAEEPPVSPSAGTYDGRKQCVAVHARQDPITSVDKALPLDTKGNTQAVAIHPHAIGRKDEAGPQAKPYRTDGKAYTHDGRGTSQAVAIRTAQTGANGHGIAEDVAHTLDGAQGQAVAFQVSHGIIKEREVIPPLMANGGPNRHGEGSFSNTDFTAIIQPDTIVRRLTPRECERLQGFPDDYTLIPSYGNATIHYDETVEYLRASGYPEAEAKELARCPDGVRYKALGNSMAVPVLAKIGRMIQLWEELSHETA